MRHRPITNVKTRIRNRRQLVIIEFNDKEFAFLSPNSIKKNTGLDVFELELLIGSTLRIDFYKKGEKTFNDKICEKDNIIVKEFFFELEKPIERLRVENAKHLLPFKKIKQLFYFFKYDKDNVGIKTDDDNVIFMPLKKFESQSHINKEEQHILIGSYVCPQYFQKGEKFVFSEDIVKHDNVLKFIIIRYSNNIENMHDSFENAIGYYDGNDYSDSHDNGPGFYGYRSWDEMAFKVAFEGDTDAWNNYKQ
ncbi:MAG: hypothetical protein WC599_05770 [Bacteroidales bacterium]